MSQFQENHRTTAAPPGRIVSLLPAATEIIYFLGLQDRLVGISHQCGQSAELAGKARVTFSSLSAVATSGQIDADVRELITRGEPLYGIDETLLAALGPELIITQAQCDVCAVRYDDVLAAARRIHPHGAIEVLALSPATLEDILQDILRVGRAAKVETKAAALLAGLRQRIDAVRCVIEPLEKPRVAVIEWTEPLMIAANWTPELVALAGGEYALAEAGRHSEYVPWDRLLCYDPHVLIVAACGFDVRRTMAEAQLLAELPGWQELRAVRDGRVWALDGDVHLNCPCPGVVDTLELLGHLLHPQRLAAPQQVRAETWQPFTRWN